MPLKNILVTGTPGVGKSRICAEIAKKHKMNYLDVSAIAKEHNFVESYDENLDCPIIDEDKLLDYLETEMQKENNIVEYHACELFPERWFSAVFVVCCNNTLLYDRLESRQYNPQKLRHNIECEIFQTILTEAQDSYAADILHTLSGETEKDFKESKKTISNVISEWKK